MGGGVGAEEEPVRTRGRRPAQGEAVHFPLGHRQTVEMRADPALEHGVAVEVEVVRRDRRGDIRPGGLDEGHGIGGGDVLEHHLQGREIGDDPGQDAVDEHRLAVEDVDMGVRHLAMDQQRHADLLHDLENRIDPAEVGHAVAGVGRGIGRIEFAGGEDAGRKAAPDLVRVDVVGQVAGHQGGEDRSRLDRREDTRAIGLCGRHGGDGRCQVGHDDGAGKLAGRIVDDRAQHGPVAQVHMPVVGPADDQSGAVGGGRRDRRCGFRERHQAVPWRTLPASIASPRGLDPAPCA